MNYEFHDLLFFVMETGEFSVKKTKRKQSNGNTASTSTGTFLFQPKTQLQSKWSDTEHGESSV